MAYYQCIEYEHYSKKYGVCKQDIIENTKRIPCQQLTVRYSWVGIHGRNLHGSNFQRVALIHYCMVLA